MCSLLPHRPLAMSLLSTPDDDDRRDYFQGVESLGGLVVRSYMLLLQHRRARDNQVQMARLKAQTRRQQNRARQIYRLRKPALDSRIQPLVLEMLKQREETLLQNGIVDWTSTSDLVPISHARSRLREHHVDQLNEVIAELNLHLTANSENCKAGDSLAKARTQPSDSDCQTQEDAVGAVAATPVHPVHTLAQDCTSTPTRTDDKRNRERKLKRRRKSAPTEEHARATMYARDHLLASLPNKLRQVNAGELSIKYGRIEDELEYQDSYSYAVQVRQGRILQIPVVWKLSALIDYRTSNFSNAETHLHSPLLRMTCQRGMARGVLKVQNAGTQQDLQESNGQLIYIPRGFSLDPEHCVFPFVGDSEINLRTPKEMVYLLEKGYVVVTHNPSHVHESLPSIAFVPIPLIYKLQHRLHSQERLRDFEMMARLAVNCRLRIGFTSKQRITQVVNSVLLAGSKECNSDCVTKSLIDDLKRNVMES